MVERRDSAQKPGSKPYMCWCSWLECFSYLSRARRSSEHRLSSGSVALRKSEVSSGASSVARSEASLEEPRGNKKNAFSGSRSACRVGFLHPRSCWSLALFALVFAGVGTARVASAQAVSQVSALRNAVFRTAPLRPVAQQLAILRSAAHYDELENWAGSHRGESAALANLALGQAYYIDQQYAQALTYLERAAWGDRLLRDYIAYLTAQSEFGAGQYVQAQQTLSSFARNYPLSPLRARIPVLRAQVYLAEQDANAALTVLEASANAPLFSRSAYWLVYAQAEHLAGNDGLAMRDYERLLADYPTTAEAAQARSYLNQQNLLHTLPAWVLRIQAEAMYRIGRYDQAKVDYLLLAQKPELRAAEQNAARVMAAACDEKMGQLNWQEWDSLANFEDEAEAHRLYLGVELARDQQLSGRLQSLIGQLEQDYPNSPWLAEALYSAANMNLLALDYPAAIRYYLEVAKRFPYQCGDGIEQECSVYSAKSHWRGTWLTYQTGQYRAAARLMDREIARYPGTEQFSTALYWRGRLYERAGRPAMAAAYYETLIRLYPHFYYALMARDRLAQLGSIVPARVPELAAFEHAPEPRVSDYFPEDDPHVLRARLLVNAGLNEFVASEISAAPGSRIWGRVAQAQIFAGGDQAWRAMFLTERRVPDYSAMPLGSLPLADWHMLYPQPYWSQIVASSQANGLDPYMVAALIRQESAFRPNAVSGAGAYGLMQMLPSVGRTMAREEGIWNFSTMDLLNPYLNIRLGTRYLRQMLDEFGGNAEYAFAAYNAGDFRVKQWRSQNTFAGMPEFVESIPFTQTREYVQALVRNERMYRELNTLDPASR